MTLRKLERADFKIITNAFSDIGYNKPIELFEKYFIESLADERVCFVSFCDDNFAGYVTLLKVSGYKYGKIGNIP